MCGIYGSTKIYDRHILLEKLNAISHRGPDANGYTHNKGVTLGHTRLSILDLDERSNQPFKYEYVTITYNGEVYNFKELKSELIKKGYQFKTTSDTEVICASYLEWGTKCVEHFNGMFAFVIFDEKENILFGARDRIGQKPFYYTFIDNEFEFSSQLKPILIGYPQKFTLDKASVSEILTRKYILGNKSIFNEIKQLEPANFFIYNLVDKKYRKYSYWEIPNDKPSFKGSYDEAVQELEWLLGDAVSKRMISDVPLGVFLSGGIDSSLIATMAQKTSSNPIRTFCIKFNERDFDESVYARKVANVLGTDHTEIECSISEGLEIVENFHEYYDEPMGDSSAIPSLLLSKYTKKNVTVALSGDAGDENFIGYSRYLNYRNNQYLLLIPKWIRARLGHVLNYSNLGYKANAIANALQTNDIYDLYNKQTSFLNKSEIVKDASVGNIFDEKIEKHINRKNNLIINLSNIDFLTVLPNDINIKVDRASMAHSLEVRTPLYDKRIIKFSREVPVDYHLKHGTKSLMRSILYKNFPKEYFERKKSGFRFPLKYWFRNELKEFVLEGFKTDKLSVIPNLKVDIAKEFLDNHLKEKEDRSTYIWNILILSKWCEKYEKWIKH